MNKGDDYQGALDRLRDKIAVYAGAVYYGDVDLATLQVCIKENERLNGLVKKANPVINSRAILKKAQRSNHYLKKELKKYKKAIEILKPYFELSYDADGIAADGYDEGAYQLKIYYITEQKYDFLKEV